MINLSDENAKLFLQTFVYITPMMWGIYEFRQFRLQLESIFKKVFELNQKIDDISKNNLDQYPFFKDTKELVDKINNVFVPK